MNPKSEATRICRFEVFRYDAGQAAAPRFQAYDVAVEENMSVLEALLKIQDEQDPSLAFRYACRGAICGSCAMSVNGNLNLACRVQLSTLTVDRLVIEPLPGLDIVKDLVVDMDPFWERYERVRPWLHAEISESEANAVTPGERAAIDQYVNCILCGLCLAACPAAKRNPAFIGPAALAKLYRFLADPREKRPSQTLTQEDSASGMWGCRTIMRCVEACPKQVRPADGIRGLRWKLLSQRIKDILR